MKSIRPFFWPAASAGFVGLVGFSLATSAGSTACVPTGSAPAFDAGATSATSSASFKPSANVMTAPFEDTFDRDPVEPSSSASAAASSVPAPPASASASASSGNGNAPSREAGAMSEAGTDAGGDAASEPTRREPSNLGPNWIVTKGAKDAWKIEGGKLCVQNAHNHGIWLNRTLPVNARIEFDATPFTDEGDLKTEVWGDGVSYATGSSYTNATSYLAILGGWKNTLQVLARQNEHGTDRKEIKIDKDSDDARQRPVQKGQTYHFKVERTDGRTVRWSVDGVDFLSWADDKPLAGQGHDHFGFNEWEAKVCFDNVKVTPL